MKRLLCTKLPTPSQSILLDSEESKHATQVLRLEVGDRIELLDGNGRAVVAEIIAKGKSVECQFHGPSSLEASRDLSHPAIIIELAILKGPSMEWAIEKLVELNVQTLLPVVTERTIVDLDKKGPSAFVERWSKIADQALKQCGRLNRLVINTPTPIATLYGRTEPNSLCLFADELQTPDLPSLRKLLDHSIRAGDPGHSGLSSIHILIGPEGGWSPTEKQALSQYRQAFSLGALVLRAETAAITAAALVSSWRDEQQVSSQKPT